MGNQKDGVTRLLEDSSSIASDVISRSMLRQQSVDQGDPHIITIHSAVGTWSAVLVVFWRLDE
jgi:hypothetical protein